MVGLVKESNVGSRNLVEESSINFSPGVPRILDKELACNDRIVNSWAVFFFIMFKALLSNIVSSYVVHQSFEARILASYMLQPATFILSNASERNLRTVESKTRFEGMHRPVSGNANFEFRFPAFLHLTQTLLEVPTVLLFQSRDTIK